MNFQKHKIALVPALLFSLMLHAQSDEKFSDHLFFGGSFGLQFGSYTYINLSPMAGYKFTPKISAGLSLTYIYYNVKEPGYTPYTSNVYGGSIFTRYMITQDFFAHAELQLLNMDIYEQSYYYYYYKGRQTIPSLLLGGGYRMPMGSNSSMNIMILYDVIDDRYSPYVSPIIQIGFGFGF